MIIHGCLNGSLVCSREKGLAWRGFNGTLKITQLKEHKATTKYITLSEVFLGHCLWVACRTGGGSSGAQFWFGAQVGLGRVGQRGREASRKGRLHHTQGGLTTVCFDVCTGELSCLDLTGVWA